MKTLAQKTRWKRALLAPIAAGSMLLLSACGPGADQDPEAPESATAEDTGTEENAADDSNAQEEQDPSDEVLTMDQVEENDSSDSCWAVMDGTIYDLTDWIEDHPGGA